VSPRTIRLTMFHKTILACLLLAPLCAASNSWEYEESHTDVHDFVTGGMLHVRMSVGDLHIVRGDSDKIRLRYTVKSRRERRLKEAHVDFEVRGNDASIVFHSSSMGDTQFDVELEVPQNTNLDIHEKVGDLTVENIEGNKDLTLSVGNIQVDEGSSGYRMVHASTGIGDVNGNGYGETSGWLGKTLRYHGDGKYELRAHVSVGDITLEGK
jgi:hypothetical protein